MILNQEGNTFIITQEKETLEGLVKNIQNAYSKIKNNNIIVFITVLTPLNLEDILKFLEISTKHRKLKHSFVMVSDKVTLNNVPDEIIVVPTIQEAHDIIEMEEMERDLGF
ncbi:ribonuclease Z [Yeosuana sp. AK3]